jgi:uncharacterized membrane protein YcaP (DUF421 family)
MDPMRIAVRAIVAYAYLLFMTRATGKRVVTQATSVDLIVSLIIGDLIDDMIWAEVSVAKFAVAVATIVGMEVLVKMATHRWAWALRLVNGTPTAVLRDGSADARALRSEQMNEKDLAHLLRLHGLDEEKDVRVAFVETNDELSVIRRPGAEPAQKEDARALRR